MKKIILLLFFALSFNAFSRKLTVTSSSDHATAPTSGMLRYFVNNALSGDTIIFSVSTVSILEEIEIFDISGIALTIDGGSNMVTIDAGRNGRCIDVSAYSSSSAITIKNLRMINGYVEDSYGWGGGLHVFISSTGTVTVENCILKDNETKSSSDGQGGALRCNGGTYKNCGFLNNKVTGTTNILGGGGVQAIGGVFINCIFSGNISGNYGGGAFATDETEFYNCTFARNYCSGGNKGGGVSSEQANKFTNCIFYDNFANGIANNIDNYQDAGIFSYCAMENTNALVGTNNNIGLSSSPFKYGGFADSLTLIQNSSCIDAGTSSGIPVLNSDFAGYVRIANGTIDLGAYEYGSVTGIRGIAESINVTVFPNPAKETLFIEGLNGNIQLNVYNANGVIVSECQTTGVIDVSSLQDGLYFIKGETSDGTIQTKIMVKH